MFNATLNIYSRRCNNPFYNKTKVLKNITLIKLKMNAYITVFEQQRDLQRRNYFMRTYEKQEL